MYILIKPLLALTSTSMLEWLGTLHLHTFDDTRHKDEYTPGEIQALQRIREARLQVCCCTPSPVP